jgi:hypothetical protein
VPDPMEILNRLRMMQARVEKLRRESDFLVEQRRDAYHDAATKLISTQNFINSVSEQLRQSGGCSVLGNGQKSEVTPRCGRQKRPSLGFPSRSLTSFFTFRLTCVLSLDTSRDRRYST